MAIDDSISRWFMELIFHKGYIPPEKDYAVYGFVDYQTTKDLHDENDCILTRKSKIEYWKEELEQIKRTGEQKDILFVAKIFGKYIRGVYK